MNNRITWLNGLRFATAFMLIAITGGSGYALQGEIKDAVEDEHGESPGLVEDGVYVSPLYDVEVTWTDAWTVGDETDPNVEHAIGGNYDGAVASDPELGDIVFLVDTDSETSVLSLGFSLNDDPVNPRLLEAVVGQSSFLQDNLFLSDEAEVVMIDSNQDTIAILAREAAPNDDHVVYMLIVSDPGREDYGFWVGLDMYEPDEYENILTSIGDDIEVEDNDIFAVFDAAEILEALGAADQSPKDEPVETEEPTEEPVETEEPTEDPVDSEEPTEEPAETEEPTEEPVETESPTETDEPTEEPVGTEIPTEEQVETEAPATEEPTAFATAAVTEDAIIPPFEPAEEPVASPGASPRASPQASPQASPESAVDMPGLVAEGDYLSPQHEVAVTWTDAWILDPDTERPVQSFTETGVDALYLSDAESGDAIVYITIENGDGPFDVAGILEAMSNPDYIESVLRLSPDSDVALTDSTEDAAGAIYVDDSGDSLFMSVLEVRAIDDDTYVFVELRANAAEIDEDLIESVLGDIAVDGQPGIQIFTVDDILDALP